MIQLNRVTEYALMALQYISKKGEGSKISAREIAQTYGLPFEMTAKTLQRLKDSKLVQSTQGIKGGYSLQKPLSEISLAEFLTLMQGFPSVVMCVAQGENKAICEYERKCEMKHFMQNLNTRMIQFLSQVKLDELIADFSKSFHKEKSYEISYLS